MRIVNPRSSVANQPLATTWYVDTQLQETESSIYNTIEAVSSTLTGQISDEAIARDLQDRIVAAVLAKQLTGKHDVPSNIEESAFTTGEDKYLDFYQDALHSEGYAWLLNGKLDPNLLPDLSIITPVQVKREDVLTWFENHGGNDNGSEMSNALKALPNDEARAEYIIEQFVCKTGLREDGTSSLADDPSLSPYVKTGDMVIVSPDMEEDDPRFNGRPYFGKRYMCGAWSVINNEPKTSAALVKISFNQGEITKVNEKIARQDGSVHLGLADIYRYSGEGATTELIGPELAHDLLSIVSMPASTYNDFSDTSTIPGLLPDGIRLGYRMRHGSAETEFIPYATLKELADLYNDVNTVIKTEISGINEDIDAISAVIDNVLTDVETISGKVDKVTENCDTISSAINNKAIEVLYSEFTWSPDQVVQMSEDEKNELASLYDSSKGDFAKLTYGKNGEIPGKIMAVYVVGADGSEEVIYPDIVYKNNVSVITTYTYNKLAGDALTEIGKTWKVYYTKELSF